MTACSTKALIVSLLMATALPGAALAQDHVSVQMNWTADSAHLGFAMAESLGIYDEYDLDVEMIEGRGSAVAAQLVATGQVDLGYADAVAALNVASQGAPIRIVSTIWKSGQFGIQSLADSGIEGPQDLIGKRLAVSPGSAMLPLIPVFLRANGIAEGDVEITNSSENAFIGLLTSGQVDAVSQTPENIVVPLAAEGIEANNMYFYTNGVPLASLSLVGREDKLAERPEVFSRFLEATARGWQEAMHDPEGAVEALMEMFPETEHSREALLQAAEYSFASVCPGGEGDIIGYTSAETWDEMYDVMTTAMDLSADRPVTDYYTLDYTPETDVLCD